MIRLLKYGIIAVTVMTTLCFGLNKITGNYYYKTMYDYHKLELNTNRTFYYEHQGCTIQYATKGKWTIKGDTLYLIRTHFKALFRNKSFKAIKTPCTEMYLHKPDTVISLEKNSRKEFVRAEILTKKMPPVFK